MRKHGKHARRSRVGRVSVVAAAGGAAALSAVFPGLAASASPLPGPGAGPASDAVVSGDVPRHGYARPAVVTAKVEPDRYTIKSGDTLAAIANEFCGSASKYPNLAGSNSLANPNIILAGHWLGVAQRDCSHKPAVYRAPVVQPAPEPSAVTSTATTHRHRHTYAQSAAHSYGYGAGTLSFSELERLWVAAGGPAWAESAAASVAECESGGRTSAYNPSGATGLWQILGAVRGGSLTDPMANAVNAVAKFEASGDTWAQWVCKP